MVTIFLNTGQQNDSKNQNNPQMVLEVKAC